jgi:Big-like domain-containing protein
MAKIMDSKIKVRAGVALVALALGTISISANAVLERVGPINPAPTHAGLPSWYQDTTGLALEFCAPTSQAEVDAGMCLVGPAEVPNFPEFFPGNFFDEHFYYDASTLLTPATGGRIVLVLAVEANAVAPGDQVVFARIRTRFDGVPVTGKYRFIHPYGDETFDGAAGGRIFVTDDMGIGSPLVFTELLKSRLGPFLVPSVTAGGAELPPFVNPAIPGKLYLADPGRSGPVTGSQATNPNEPGLAPGTFIPRSSTDPNATASAVRNQNIFRVEGPLGSGIGGPGVDFIETENFGLIGRIYTGPIAGRVDVNRASKTRKATGQQTLDVFATGSATTQGRIPPQPRPAAVLPSLSFFDAPCASALDANGFPVPPYSAPTSANETSMLIDAANGMYWAQIASTAPTAIPTAVCVKDNNARDALGNLVPNYVPRNVADVVTITQAAYDPVAQTLTVAATSSDELGLPVLTLAYGITGAGVLDATTGQVVVPSVLVAPDKVKVISSEFGVKDEQVRTSAGAAGPNQSPVAVADTGYTVVQGASVQINVLDNDTDSDGGTLSVTGVPVVSPLAAGTVTNNGINVTFNSSANFNGPATFNYAISDGQGGTATAQVSVTVTAGANQPPVANADSTTTAFNTPVTIAVLANDTDPNGDALSVVGATAGTGGTVSFNSTSVTFAPAAGFSGQGTFSYTVSDGNAQVPGNGTVNVGLAPTLTVTLADFRAAGSEWRLAGTNATVGATITVSLNGGTNPVIGTAVVSAARTWTLRVRNSTIVPTAGSSISLQSTDGATASATVTLR